jgi:hypothetical protein
MTPQEHTSAEALSVMTSGFVSIGKRTDFEALHCRFAPAQGACRVTRVQLWEKAESYCPDRRNRCLGRLSGFFLFTG